MRKNKAKFLSNMKHYIATHFQGGRHHKPTHVKMSQNYKKLKQALKICGLSVKQTSDHVMEIQLTEDEILLLMFDKTNTKAVTKLERRNNGSGTSAQTM